MTHAEEIATIKQNHREDLQDIYGELKSINKSVTHIETELNHKVGDSEITGIVDIAIQKQLATRSVSGDNGSNHKPERRKNDWITIAKNTAYIAALGGSVTTAIVAGL